MTVQQNRREDALRRGWEIFQLNTGWADLARSGQVRQALRFALEHVYGEGWGDGRHALRNEMAGEQLKKIEGDGSVYGRMAARHGGVIKALAGCAATSTAAAGVTTATNGWWTAALAWGVSVVWTAGLAIDAAVRGG